MEAAMLDDGNLKEQALSWALGTLCWEGSVLCFWWEPCVSQEWSLPFHCVCLFSPCRGHSKEREAERSRRQLQSSAGSVRVEPARPCTQVMWDSVDGMDRSLPGPSVHGIFQARILEWVGCHFLLHCGAWATCKTQPKVASFLFYQDFSGYWKNVVDLLHSARKVLGAEWVDFIA